MNALMTEVKSRGGFEGLVAACRIFVDWYQALRGCDPETQADIEELLAAMHSEELDDIERDSALASIAQVLLPALDPELAADRTHDSWTASSEEEATADHTLDAEEATFAQRLSEIMRAKGVTQVALAALTDVGQPAIAMMLSRDCRPQRRTVEKFAKALGVSPQDLWPGCGEVRTEAISQESVCDLPLTPSEIPPIDFSRTSDRPNNWPTMFTLEPRIEGKNGVPPLRGAA